MFDRVGDLLLLPNTEVATTKQVAEFYGVDSKAIQWHLKENREELEANCIAYKKFLQIKEKSLTNLTGSLTLC